MITKSKSAAVSAVSTASALLLMALLGTTSSNAKTFDADPKVSNSRPVRARANFITCVPRKKTHCRKDYVRAGRASRSPFLTGCPSTWAWGGTMGLLLLVQFALLWRQIAQVQSRGESS